MLFQAKAPLWPIAGCRILIGVMWLLSLRWKLPPDFVASGEHHSLMEWLQLEVQYPAFGFYAQLIETVILPNFTLFAWLIFLGELLVGLSLLTGALTRLGSLLGLLMSINLGIGLLEVPGEWPWAYLMMAMWHGLFVISGPGQVFGIDGWLRKHLPDNTVWQWLI